MNLPNLLSIFRLFITVFFIFAVNYGRFDIALLLFIIQAISDLLDGFLARKMDAKTSLGAYLDPLADKVMLASSYIVLCIQAIIPLWLVVLVLVRDIVISLGFLVLMRRGLRTSPVPSFVSKATTVLQMLTIVYALWSSDRSRSLDSVFFYTTALFTAASGFQYVFVGWTDCFRKESV
jgi:cardiolipin synthase (CMP-forming)